MENSKSRDGKSLKKNITSTYNIYKFFGQLVYTACLYTFREVAAASVLQSKISPAASSPDVPPLMQTPSAIKSDVNHEQVNTSKTSAGSSWSSMLGLWAWNTREKKDVAPVGTKEETRQKP